MFTVNTPHWDLDEHRKDWSQILNRFRWYPENRECSGEELIDYYSPWKDTPETKVWNEFLMEKIQQSRRHNNPKELHDMGVERPWVGHLFEISVPGQDIPKLEVVGFVSNSTSTFLFWFLFVL
jgi:hypothetical protein